MDAEMEAFAQVGRRDLPRKTENASTADPRTILHQNVTAREGNQKKKLLQ
jgi:hypothetical protein